MNKIIRRAPSRDVHACAVGALPSISTYRRQEPRRSVHASDALEPSFRQFGSSGSSQRVPTVGVLERDQVVEGVPETRPAREVRAARLLVRGAVLDHPSRQKVHHQIEMAHWYGLRVDQTPSATGVVDEPLQCGLSATFEVVQL